MEKNIDKAIKAYKKGDFLAAVKYYSKLLEVSLNDPDLFYDRAMSYYHLSDFQKCIQDMNEAQKLQPNNPYRYSSRAYVKNKIGDFDGAIEDYQKAVHLDPEDAIAYNNLGLAMEAKGYSENAKTHFSKADELANEKESVKRTIPKPNFIETDEVIDETLFGYLSKNVTNGKFFKEFMQFVKNGFKLSK